MTHQIFPMESQKSGIWRGREVFSCRSPLVANLTVNHSSLFKTSYHVKADFASFYLLIKRQQGGEQERTPWKCRWAEKLRLAKNLASSPTSTLQCAPFHAARKLLRAVHFHSHCSFTPISTGLLEFLEGEGSKIPFKLCVALYATWLQASNGWVC